ncbi:temperature shock-inducible protein 1 [[Candida] railenensis]|uniref:Temperature shock-inducible protein 1 n=1 Tax=[Candida] railenensis TaxID=45579 RepID=A0A9P0QRD5_9ASCO|nr:temperature shock-inducible protein 1 [[Candida] railenensis]
MKASQLITASALSTAVLGATSVPASEIEFLTVLVNDLKSNQASYLGYVATATDIPSGVTALALEVQTYTDDSYTTLLDSGNIDVAAIESFAAGLPWYTRLEAQLTGAASGSASGSGSASASGSASGSSVAASTSGASSAASASASASESGSASITSAASSASSEASSAASGASSGASSEASSASSGTSSAASSGASSAASSSAAASSTSSQAAGVLNIVDARLITIGSLIACLF